jgi:Fic family protein
LIYGSYFMLKDEDIQALKDRGIPTYHQGFPPSTQHIFTERIVGLIGEANREVGNLNSYARIIPNPDLLVWPLLLKESLASSKIEGTQASVKDVLKSEANLTTSASSIDIQEVINYREATKLGLELLNQLPISERLVKKVHERLMWGTVRGAEKRTGEFRIGQNAIGIEGDLTNIKYIPPPPNQVSDLMENLFRYTNNETILYDKLVKCAFIHFEFEAIHPFADGNGRVGRLLITLYLLKEGVLKYPLIYPSAYFLHYKDKYMNSLMGVTTDNNWVNWLEFFLQGIAEQARRSGTLIEQIDSLYQKSREITRQNMQSVHADKLVELVFTKPIVLATEVSTKLSVNHQTAISLLRKLSELGIVNFNSKTKKNIPFTNSKLINLLENS